MNDSLKDWYLKYGPDKTSYSISNYEETAAYY